MKKFLSRPPLHRMIKWTFFSQIVILFGLAVLLSSCVKNGPEYKCIDGKLFVERENLWVESYNYKGQTCKPKHETGDSHEFE